MSDGKTESGDITTHGIKITFGKHKGLLVTRVPVSYLRWMANEVNMEDSWRKTAQSELTRRGSTMPQIELTGHAIDRASLRVWHQWNATRGKGEGLHSWLQRMTLEAIAKGERRASKIVYLGMKFVVEAGEEFPVLKSIMED